MQINALWVLCIPLRAIHEVITAQLCKKLIMQAEVKIAVISREDQDSVSISHSLQTANAFHNTSMHAISKQCNTFTDTITALQWFCTEKREAYTLTAGWLSRLMSLCSFTAFSTATTRTKYSFDHITVISIPLTVVYPVQTQITPLRGCLQAKIHCTLLQLLRYYLDPMHNSTSDLNMQLTILTHIKNEYKLQ